MKEGIQLDLFHGVVLSKDQQLKIDELVNKNNEFAKSLMKSHDHSVKSLEEAGFVRGVDFEANYRIKEVTENRSFGYSYNNTEWEHECTYDRVVGDISLLANTIKDGKIVVESVSINKEGNKFMCYRITDQWRYYIPTSLLKKLKEYNNKIVIELNIKKREDDAINSLITKYNTLYPTANVKRGSDHYGMGRGYRSFPIIKIEFNSGSYVWFKLDYGYNEIFHKKYDAQAEGVEDLLSRFSKQVKE